jgi:peptidoglycan/xylan/chitin deacetylase (PgdA/CDA1 family)
MGQTLQARWRRRAKRLAISGGLETASMLHRLGAIKSARGRGAIFTLHHVRPHQSKTVEPNAHLEITPEFLDAAIRVLKAEGYRFVALADVPALLADPAETQPFAAFTLDDGYRNNAAHALPVFERHGVPFTVFVTSGFADRTHSIWWETVVELLNTAQKLSFDFGHGVETIDLSTAEQKIAAFDRFCTLLPGDDEAAVIARIDETARSNGINPLGMTADLTMSEDELKRLANHPLAALGAHTVTHHALGYLNEAEAQLEISMSADRIEAMTGRRPTTIAYPYGCSNAATPREFQLARQLGFVAGVTTQPGVLGPAALAEPFGLPRISLNGLYQRRRYVAALASGIPFRMMR